MTVENSKRVEEAKAPIGIQLSIDDQGMSGSVARIVVANAARLNIVNRELLTSLIETIGSVAEDERLRVVILTGEGERAFIGGADVNEMAELDGSSARNFISLLHEACRAIRDLPVPVIARVSGFCLGAGLEIAASCDLRVATEDSTFGMPEVRVGIPSVIEAALLPRLIGWGKTSELILTGESIPASEALACGLVEKVVSREQLDGAVDRWVHAILKAGPRAIRLQKALLREWERLPLDRAIERGIDVFGAAYDTDEPQIMMRQFIDRPRTQN